MLRTRLRSFLILLTIVTLCTCIDPYDPQMKGYESLLVVEGLITDENASYEVKLSRTMQTGNSIPERVSDATLYITDETGSRSDLENLGNGLYKTDSTLFRGAVGKTYTLHITTGDGRNYASEPCVMLPVPDIDSVYYEKEEEITDNQNETQKGIRIYLDSKGGGISNQYLRWQFEETWKFRVPMPKKFNYINDTTILPVNEINEFCWKHQKSSEILVNSIPPGEGNFIKKEPVFFIASDKSDRLSIQYSILVKQFCISKKEYDFWDNLKQVNESGGDIFDSQPFPVISNIYNIDQPEERVLGYFQVSGVKQKRIFITFGELLKYDLPFYFDGCERSEVCPDDFPVPPWASPFTFDYIYAMFDRDPKYAFVEPIYEIGTRILSKLVFTTVECSDCELRGTSLKPDFWIDLN